MNDSADKNFNQLAERFAKRVYGGLKGEIRLAVLWRDLEAVVDSLQTELNRPLRILDVGAGLAQLSLRLAELGHTVVVNDVSQVMLDKAQTEAQAEWGVQWLCCPYQELQQHLQGECFDIILCHALLEWLQQPEQVLPTIRSMLNEGGYVSLCFYNPDGKIYRNLIRGNFNWLETSADYVSDAGSLTPNHPCSLQQVRAWLSEQQFRIESETGLRVFHDYVVEKRGGHQFPEQVLAMELQYSTQEPFKWLGRYLHVLASKN